MTARTVMVGDASLACIDVGEGPNLLFLHGEDGLIFSGPLLDELAVTHRVLAPDHPAFGASSRPAHVTEVRDLAAVYAELLETLDEPVTIVGCSLGGWIAAELALRTRAAVTGIVLVSPTGVKLGGREDRDYADIFVAAFDELPGIWYGDPARAPSLAGREDDDYLYLARAQEATARYCWKPYMYDPKLRHWLRRIGAPTLVVAGSEDRFALRPGHYAEYAALIGPGGAALRTLAGAGHRIEEEEPEQLARIVRDFLAGDAVRGAAIAATTTGS